MRILVTGGAGFIGSHIAERLLELGHHVVVLDDLSTGREENIPGGVEFVKGDITDRQLVSELMDDGRFDVVNHHAAQMDVRRSVEDPTFDARVNILGILNLLQCSIKGGVKKFMFASTGGAVYGEQARYPADEDHPTRPVSPYGISKLAGEGYLFYYRIQCGLQTVIMRYANIYGPRQNPFGEAGVVAIFSHKLAQDEQVTIHGDGLQTRDYVYIEDVVTANLLALDNADSITFNVGSGIETDVVTLYKHLAKAAGTDLPPRHGPPKPGEQRRSSISPQFAYESLGWRPKVPLAEGLARTFHSFITADGRQTSG
ncbi:MAG: NAD-dependent epimerase/dehydratase family protein [Fidelibacterota bacterium]|nr:MAG: NAD-dependent epimerase/dehydratase family protein [Candidatus Neomarinimicrobiota bacterium]